MHRGSSLSPAGALLPLQEPLLQRLGSLQYVTILTSTRLRFQEGHRHWDGTRGYRRRVRLWLRRLWLRRLCLQLLGLLFSAGKPKG